jgi:hypothetical protein
MDDVRRMVAQIQLELTPMFEERLRELLADTDREWLVDQVVRLTLDSHSLQEIDRRAERDAKAAARAARLERVKTLAVDEEAVRQFVAEHGGATREGLESAGLIMAGAPVKGSVSLGRQHRSPEGERLLELAKDMLFALLFGDTSSSTILERTQQELLTFAVPRFKAGALDFMRASTELAAAGTWQDPESVSNDERADNVLLEVQFGDTSDEVVGNGVVVALGLVNLLEVNEQVLYARMINVEQTTLIG